MLDKMQKTGLFMLCLAIVIALILRLDANNATNLINTGGAFAIGLCIVLCPIYIRYYKPQAELPLEEQEALQVKNMEKGLAREHLSFMDGNTVPRKSLKVRSLCVRRVDEIIAELMPTPIARRPDPQQVITNESRPSGFKVHLPSVDENGVANLSAFSKWSSRRS